MQPALPLIDIQPAQDGATFDPVLDGPRLSRQLLRVQAVMQDGAWRSLAEIALASEAPESSVSARLRDMRKRKFGCHQIDKRRRTVGTWEYRLVQP